MLASSPSPSNAFHSPTSSSPSHPHPSSHPVHSHHLPRDENSRPPAPDSATRELTPRSSRLALDELRSALNRHTVDSASPGPSGDLLRGPISARQTSLEGDNLTSATSNSKPSHGDGHRHHHNPTAVSAPGSDLSTNPSMSTSSNSGSNKRTGQNESADNAATEGSDNSGMEVSQSKRLRPSGPNVKLLPELYELADTSDIVVLISSMLMELIQLNDKIPLHQGRLTRFHSRSPPRISVHDYLQRLTTHATLSPPILLSMVYYIDRLCALYPAFTVSSLTIHRFLIASATVASKGLSDSFWTNKTYARVGGISMAELALLELELLIRVEWRIVPQPEVLVDYYQSLVVRCDGYQIQHGNAVA